MDKQIIDQHKNKSELFGDIAQLLHNQNSYLGVAHAAYYSCYQLLLHIWKHSMRKDKNELDVNISQSKKNTHTYLLNEVVKYILNTQKKDAFNDSRIVRDKVPQLKKLRVDADYSDEIFDSSKSAKSISMSKEILSILRKY